MNADIDRPSTWRFFKEGMCKGCDSLCCTLPVEATISDLVRIGLVTEDEATADSPRKIARRLEKERLVQTYRDRTGFFTISQRSNRDCHFLDPKSRSCTIYDRRPETCRRFPQKGPRPGYCPHQLRRREPN